MESSINQTLSSDLDVWYFVRALFHLLKLLQNFLILKVVLEFWELIREKQGRVCIKENFGMTCFMEKILTIMWCSRNLSVLWCLGCNRGEEGLRVKWSEKAKTIFKRMVALSEFFFFFFFLSNFYIDFFFSFNTMFGWCGEIW